MKGTTLGTSHTAFIYVTGCYSVCAVAEEPVQVYRKGTEIVFVRVPWHLVPPLKGYTKPQGVEVQERGAALGAQAPGKRK